MNKNRNTHWLYLDGSGCQGSYPSFWQTQWPAATELPEVRSVTEALQQAQVTGRAALLLDENWLRPLKLQREPSMSRKNLPEFVRWRLKRYLPYAVDQALVRFIALADSDQLLVMTLPEPWVNRLFEACQSVGLHLGYIGALSTWLMENRQPPSSCSLLLYRETYSWFQVDRKSRAKDYSHRHLPLLSDGSLDVQTMVDRDLSNGLNSPLRLINLDASHDRKANDLVTAIRNKGGSVTANATSGSLVERVLGAQGSEVGQS